MRFPKHNAQTTCQASPGSPGPEQDREFPSRGRRFPWKAALDTIALPAMRLHRYRNVHNRLLQDAWCQLDCHDSGDGSA